jgi:hypothetical protein
MLESLLAASFHIHMFFYLLHTLAGSGTCFAQQHTLSWHGAVVDAVCTRLSKTYIYPEHASQMCALLKANLATGKYADINDPLKFANRLTTDLQSINNDKHLSLYYAPAEVTQLKVKQSDTAGSRKMQADLLAAIREWNFGFRSTSILDGTLATLT